MHTAQELVLHLILQGKGTIQNCKQQRLAIYVQIFFFISVLFI